MEQYKPNKNTNTPNGILNISGSASSPIIHKLAPDIKSKKKIFNKIIKIKINIFSPQSYNNINSGGKAS